MKKRKILWKILKYVGADKILISFLIFILLNGFFLMMVEPNIVTYGDSIWYSFSIITTIGFGDIYATTTVGRVLSILLGVYSIFVVALIPGIIVNYFMEVVKLKTNSSRLLLLDKLQNLDQLSKQELKELSDRIKSKID